MKLQRFRGSTSNLIRVFIPDPAATDGSGLTGLAYNDASLTISVIRELEAAPAVYAAFTGNTENITTLGTWANPSSGKCRFKEVDPTNMPGVYELQFRDSVFGSGDASRFLTGLILSDGAQCPFEVQLDASDLDTLIAAIKAKTDNLPSDPADASDIAASFSTVNTKLDAIDDYVDTEVAAIKAKTDGLPSDPADASDIAAAFATVNTKLDTIDDFLDTEIAAIKAKTDNLPADPADASDIAASFTTVNGKLDAIDDYVDTEVAAIKAKTDNLPSDPADQSLIIAATDAIFARIGAPVGASISVDIAALPTAGEAADAVWEETLADHSGTAGSTAEALGAAGASGDPWTTALPGAYGAGSAGKIIGDNINATVSSRAAASALATTDGKVDAIKAKTDNLPSDPADASDIAAAFATINTKLDAIDDFVDTEVAAIKAKTDALPSDPADASDIAGAFGTVNATLATIAGYIDTEVGAIKAKTDNLPADPADASDIATLIAAVQTKLGAPAGASVSADIAAVKSNTTAIKAKTDSLTFTEPGQVDANVQRINDVPITGDGQPGTEFGV